MSEIFSPDERRMREVLVVKMMFGDCMRLARTFQDQPKQVDLIAKLVLRGLI